MNTIDMLKIYASFRLMFFFPDNRRLFGSKQFQIRLKQMLDFTIQIRRDQFAQSTELMIIMVISRKICRQSVSLHISHR